MANIADLEDALKRLVDEATGDIPDNWIIDLLQAQIDYIKDRAADAEIDQEQPYRPAHNPPYLGDLVSLLKRTDFLYPWSDDPDARERGRQQVSTARAEAVAFASHSHEHAQLASIAWDQTKPADMALTFDHYVPERERTITTADYQAALQNAPQDSIEDGLMQSDPDYLAFQAEEAEIETGRERISEELHAEAGIARAEYEGIAAEERNEAVETLAEKAARAAGWDFLSAQDDHGETFWHEASETFANHGSWEDLCAAEGIDFQPEQPDNNHDDFDPFPSAKYEILPDRTHPFANADGDHFRPLYQIRALIDIPPHDVKAGDLGGYVESEANLSQEGQAWIADTAYACGQARVEGAALLKDSAAATSQSHVHGYAIAEGFSYLGGNTDLSGNAHIRHVSMFDNAKLGGNIKVMSERVFSGNESYETDGSIPFDFSRATGREPDYYSHLDRALETDPKIAAYFGALGYETLEDQRLALKDLWSGPDRQAGRAALVEMTRLVGGVFRGDEYRPRDAANIFHEAVFSMMAAAYPGLSEFRYPDMLLNRDEDYRHPETGKALYPVILAVEMATGPDFSNKTLFQPGFIIENDDPGSGLLVPLPGSLTTLPSAYDTRMEALEAAIHHVESISGVVMDTPRPNGDPATIAKMMTMPVLMNAGFNHTRPGHVRFDRDLTFLVPDQKQDLHAGWHTPVGSPSEFKGFVTLTINTDLMQIAGERERDRINIAAAVRTIGFAQPSMATARDEASQVYGSDPKLAARLLAEDVAYDTDDVRKLRAALDTHPDKRSNDAQILRDRIMRREPGNVSVPVMSSHEFAKMPDLSVQVPCAMQIRHSEGYSYFPGTLTITDGIVTAQATVQTENAPGRNGSYADPDSALMASERWLSDHSRKQWNIAYGVPNAPAPEHQTRKESATGPAVSF